MKLLLRFIETISFNGVCFLATVSNMMHSNCYGFNIFDLETGIQLIHELNTSQVLLSQTMEYYVYYY